MLPFNFIKEFFWVLNDEYKTLLIFFSVHQGSVGILAVPTDSNSIYVDRTKAKYLSRKKDTFWAVNLEMETYNVTTWNLPTKMCFVF